MGLPHIHHNIHQNFKNMMRIAVLCVKLKNKTDSLLLNINKYTLLTLWSN